MNKNLFFRRAHLQYSTFALVAEALPFDAQEKGFKFRGLHKAAPLFIRPFLISNPQVQMPHQKVMRTALKEVNENWGQIFVSIEEDLRLKIYPENQRKMHRVKKVNVPNHYNHNLLEGQKVLDFHSWIEVLLFLFGLKPCNLI